MQFSDIILNNIIPIISFLIIGYLLGSIPNGIIVAKVFFHKDPRDFGSGNTGGTNVGRVFGKKFGLITIFLDMIKIVLALVICYLLSTKVVFANGKTLTSEGFEFRNSILNYSIYWVSVLGASIGHCFPIFAKFKGGKNVSCFFGLIASVSWFFGVISFITFMIILKLKKMVSFSSILTSVGITVVIWAFVVLIDTGVIKSDYYWIFSNGAAFRIDYLFASLITVNCGILVYSHRANIKRIINHEERKISWMK